MKLPLFGIGMQGKTPVVTAKVLQNFFVEYRPQGEKTQVVAHGFPGLDTFVTSLGATQVRGMITVEQDDLLYVVHRGILHEINGAGVTTPRGTLNSSSGFVGTAHNGTQVMITDGINGYIFNTSTDVFAQITDVDFPANPTSVTFLDGYFVVGLDNGKFYISTINNGTAWDALDFATAESDPDRLIRVFADHGELILFGDISTEFWANSGAADFPFAKIQGANAEWGLAARWSACKFDDSVALLCKNKLGQVIVGKIVGHRLQKISTPDLDTEINGYAATSDATGFSYILDGHPFYQLNFPSESKSWCFDGLTGLWSPRKSYGQTRHRCEFAVQYLSRTILSDSANGNLYKLNKNTYTENGETIEGEIIGEHWDNELEPLVIDNVRLDMEVGVGTTSGQGSDPQVMLAVSRDGGKTYGTEMWRSFGALGKYRTPIEWRRLGIAERWTMKFRVTDPVKRTVLGAYVNI